MKSPDSLIFDMDGTLWDAVDSYCAVWDAAIARKGLSRPPVTREELLALMGHPLEEIMQRLFAGHDCPDAEDFMAEVTACSLELMPRLGGRLYPAVAQTLAQLKAAGVKLFMLSNCGADDIDNFLDYTGLRPMFIDALSYGATGVDKDVNIRRLVERYSLERPLYVGDIQRDADSAHAAAVGFVWAAYGFGQVADAEYRIDRFDDLLTLFDYGN